MRVVGAGLAVFLAVTAILLYQVSSGGGDTVAVANEVSTVPSLEPTATAAIVPSATPITQPTRALPTATPRTVPPTATPTSVPVEPTPEPVVTEMVEEPVVVETEVVETEPIEEIPATEPTLEPIDDYLDSSEPSLAAVDHLDPWGNAIQTPNGGIIGMIASGVTNVRALPSLDAEVLDELHAGWPVAIYGAVIGETVAGTDIWYQVSGGGYLSASLVQPFVPSEPDTYYAGRWVDVDLTRNIAVAYIDDVPVNAVVIISGKPGFETPVGEHTIFARVESETLDSATVGIPKGDPEYYYLPDVPYTQYFATGGFAIHANYWSDRWQFGTASSHGCLNMFEDDAAWFWWFLDIGSIVNIHY